MSVEYHNKMKKEELRDSTYILAANTIKEAIRTIRGSTGRKQHPIDALLRHRTLSFN